MFNVVLYQPEIAPNTGNIIRLCANTGSTLHLVHPLGFELDDRRLRRAGLDYHEFVRVREHDSLQLVMAALQPSRVFAVSTHGRVHHTDISYRAGDAFLFGPETRGLPDEVLGGFGPHAVVRLPMLPDSRSLNLSNAVAVLVYEAWRQQGFAGARLL